MLLVSSSIFRTGTFLLLVPGLPVFFLKLQVLQFFVVDCRVSNSPVPKLVLIASVETNTGNTEK